MSLIQEWPNSAQAWARTKQSLGGGVSTGMRASMKPHPLFFSGGSGPRMTDLDGNTYLDYVLGWGPVILGHGHQGLTEAVAAQIGRGATYGAGHNLEFEVAERVLATIPGAERVLWSNTGTEADQVALRLTRAHRGRHRFIKFGGHYHGWSDAMLLGYRPGADGSLSGLGTRGQLPSSLDDISVLPWGDLEAVAQELRRPGSDIAAIFVEPVLCNSGVSEPPAGFLAGLRSLCDESGAVLVFDEVITGFRIGSGGAVTRYGVSPDLVVLAKAIAGGYPLAAVAGRAEIIDQMTHGVTHAGTYNGNPMVLSAAAATLEALSAPGIYDDFERRGAALASGFKTVFENAGALASINQVGPVIQIMPGVTSGQTFGEFLTSDQGFYDSMIVHMLRRGLFTLPGGRWYISTAHTDADIALTIDIVAQSVAATIAERGLPASS